MSMTVIVTIGSSALDSTCERRTRHSEAPVAHADRKGDHKPGDSAADDERGGDRCSVHDHAADFDAPAVGAAERSVGEVPDVLAVFLEDASVDADRRPDVAGAELVPGHEARALGGDHEEDDVGDRDDREKEENAPDQPLDDVARHVPPYVRGSRLDVQARVRKCSQAPRSRTRPPERSSTPSPISHTPTTANSRGSGVAASNS